MSHINAESHYSLQLGGRGRIVLPAAVRRQIGLEEGDWLILTVEADGSLRLVDARKAASRGRGLFRHLTMPGHSLVDEFIAERREEARKEGL